MIKKYLFTSESVTEGHPDKVCDQISDAVLDFCLKKDSFARVACETFATTNTVVVGGEVGFKSDKDSQSLSSEINSLVVNVVKEIGYEQEGFHWNNLKVSNFIHQQSSDISQGVDKDGAGDQGIMFGYAVNETEELMPAPIQYSHLILKSLAEARHKNITTSLGPDSKSQLTFKYENERPVSVESIVALNNIENSSLINIGKSLLVPRNSFNSSSSSEKILVVSGYGSGHGVGMSQWGAKFMANKGEKAEQILKHFYRGVKIKPFKKYFL